MERLAAVTNPQGDVVIVTARDLRALNQYRNKRLTNLQSRQARCTKVSRRWKRLQCRNVFLLARNSRQQRDIEYTVTRATSIPTSAHGTLQDVALRAPLHVALWDEKDRLMMEHRDDLE